MHLHEFENWLNVNWLKLNVYLGAGSLTISLLDNINRYLQIAVLLATLISILIGIIKSLKNKSK